MKTTLLGWLRSRHPKGEHRLAQTHQSARTSAVHLMAFDALPIMKTSPTKMLVLTLCATLSLLAQFAPAAEPANPKTTAQARAVLDYFHELSARKEGRRILSGQFATSAMAPTCASWSAFTSKPGIGQRSSAWTTRISSAAA